MTCHGDRLYASIGSGTFGGHAASGHLALDDALFYDVFAVVVVVGRAFMLDEGQYMFFRVLPAIVRGKSLRLPYDGFWEAFTPRKTYGP